MSGSVRHDFIRIPTVALIQQDYRRFHKNRWKVRLLYYPL